MRHPSQLVIFDCDGVLVDSEPISNRVWCECLRTVGWMHTNAESHEMFVGRSMADCVGIVEERLNGPLPDGFVARFRAISFEVFRRELKAVEGVSDAIAGIVSRGIAVCVASSGPHEKIRLSLSLTGLLPHFEGRMFSAVDVPRGKPHPDLFLHAARRMNVDPTRCAVVEDSAPGALAGTAAGMRVLGYSRSADAAALYRAGAATFDDMARLPELV